MPKKTNKKPPDLKYKVVKGRIKVLKAVDYKGSRIYLRQIDGDLFMYDLVFRGEIYSSYLVMLPKKGCKKLTKSEVAQTAALTLAGATTTIDMLLGHRPPQKVLEMAKTFEKVGKRVFANPEKERKPN